MPQDVASTAPVTKILLIRHGSTKLNHGGDGNSSECIRGWLDVPLSPKGRKEAQEVAEKLSKVDFDGIISSDLSRAEDTAKIISEETGVPILCVSRGLRPWDVGDLAGKPVEGCLDILHDHIANKPDVKMPNGESFNEFKNRCLNCLDDIRKSYPGKTIGLVAHHRNERLLAAWKASGGGPSETIKPDLFYEKGIPPADFVRHTLAKGPGDDGDEADDDSQAAAPAVKKKAPATRPTKPRDPAKASPKIAQNSPGDQARVFKRPRNLKDGLVKTDPFDLKPQVPIKKSKDGLVKKDPFDLKPLVPIKKGAQTWASAIRGSILES